MLDLVLFTAIEILFSNTIDTAWACEYKNSISICISLFCMKNKCIENKHTKMYLHSRFWYGIKFPKLT